MKKLIIPARNHGKVKMHMKEIYNSIRRKTYKREVSRVIDGDTFVIKPDILGFDRIRLSGVDTPEIGSGKKADEMTIFLRKLILRKKVRIIIVGYNTPKGKFKGRWVAEVYCGSFSTTNVCDRVQKELLRESFWGKTKKFIKRK